MNEKDMTGTIGPALDMLNARIVQIENKLVEKGLVVAARVVLYPDKSGVEHWLAFGKLANKYQFVVELWTNGTKDQSAPLVGESIATRIDATFKLTALYGALHSALIEVRNNVEEAVARANTFLREID